MRVPTDIPRTVAPCLLLAVLAAAVYWPVHRFDFVNFDDNLYVYSNPSVQAGFSAQTIRVAFHTFLLGNWNPLLWFSYYLDRSLFDLRPGPMHVENVLIHLAGGLLLWHFLVASTGKRFEAFLVAALFVCHPMHVESVAWISERKDVLSTAWLFAAMAAYVHYCQQPPGRRRIGWYLTIVGCFAISLLCKTMGMTLPAVLLLLDFWPLKRWPARSWTALVVEKLPLFALSIASAIIAAIAQVHVHAAASVSELGLLDRVSNASISYVLYIAKMFAPVGLAVVYPYTRERELGAVLAALGLLMVITIVVYRLRGSRPYLIVGWLWFFGTLLPVSGLMQIGGTAMADRYSYFPYVGLFIAVVWLAREALPKAFFMSGSAAALLALTIVAHNQDLYWRNSQSLFSHALEVTDHNPVAHLNLAMDALNRNDPHTAVDQCNLALRDGPNSGAFEGLGNCWLNDDPSVSLFYYKAAESMDPSDPRFHVDLATALDRAGQHERAVQEAREAVSLQPDFAPAQVELTKVLSSGH